MAVLKFQKVKSIKRACEYITQHSKTDLNLISSYLCNPFDTENDFKEIYNKRKSKMSRDTKNKSRMLIQSFDPSENITPELAHQIANELADHYFKGEHQYIIATHIDNNHIHNHIIFNEVKYESLLMFDTKKKHMIDDLQKIDNELSLKYNLTQTFKKEHSKDKMKRNTTQREYVVRSKGQSFKDKLENAIDDCILSSSTYEDFLRNMEQSGYKYKEGKHLAFENTQTGKFMRSKTIGFHYSEQSIRYRINNKDFEIEKPTFSIKKRWIDKSEQKYQENYGLRKWATLQNIDYLLDLSDKVINKKQTLAEVFENKENYYNFYSESNRQIDSMDNILNELQSRSDCFSQYSKSFTLINEYKKSKDKSQFKKEHFKEFKVFDKAKRDMTYLKEKYGIETIDDFNLFKERSKKERNHLYQNITKQQREIEREKQRTKDKDINL